MFWRNLNKNFCKQRICWANFKKDSQNSSWYLKVISKRFYKHNVREISQKNAEICGERSLKKLPQKFPKRILRKFQGNSQNQCTLNFQRRFWGIYQWNCLRDPQRNCKKKRWNKNETRNFRRNALKILNRLQKSVMLFGTVIH